MENKILIELDKDRIKEWCNLQRIYPSSPCPCSVCKQSEKEQIECMLMEGGLYIDRDYKIKEQKMIIETKYTKGDKVIYINREIIDIPCNICDGKGEIDIKGKVFECPECRGSKSSWRFGKWYVAGEIMIDHISIDIAKTKNDKTEIYYFSIKNGKCVKEQDCFSTIKDAQDECDRRNNAK